MTSQHPKVLLLQEPTYDDPGAGHPSNLGSALNLNRPVKQTIAKSREGHSVNVTHWEEKHRSSATLSPSPSFGSWHEFRVRGVSRHEDSQALFPVPSAGQSGRLSGLCETFLGGQLLPSLAAGFSLSLFPEWHSQGDSKFLGCTFTIVWAVQGRA